LDDIKDKFNIPIIGLINPAASEAEKLSTTKRLAIMATAQTTASHAYKNAILKLNQNCDIAEIACPKLVPIVENGNVFSDEGKATALEYFSEVVKFKADTLIYGCSHYPYFKPIFTEISSSVINFVDPAKTVVEITMKKLQKINSEVKEPVIGKTKFYVSGSPQKFTDFIDKYFYWHNIDIETHSFM
jgi:glutamate racemase